MGRGISRREALKTVAAAGVGACLTPPNWYPELPFAPESPLRVAGQPAELSLTPVNSSTVRIALLPVAPNGEVTPTPSDGALVRDDWPAPALRVRSLAGVKSVRLGRLRLEVVPAPLTVRLFDGEGSAARLVQEMQWIENASSPAGTEETPYAQALAFTLGAGPLYGLGQGGPQFDRRGALDRMGSGQAGFQLATHGAKVPIQLLLGTEGWGIFIHRPLGAFDLRGTRGLFIPGGVPAAPRPGAPPSAPRQPVPLLPMELFVTVASEPAKLLAEYAALTGLAEMPPRWAFGYQQSHRTLGTPEEILAEARTFRDKKLPCDAMIYLGTDFCPNGWNTHNGEFAWNPAAFPDPPAAIAQLHRDNFKVVLHVVLEGKTLSGTVADPCTAAPLPSGRLPDGTWPPDRQVSCYWPVHKALLDLGVDGWWPDQGDGLDAASRLARNRMYFDGTQQVRPNQRVYALHRNAYAGMQRYAAFLWSGDIQSRWITLKTHIAVGINAGLSGMPWWGTDIGGFVPTSEYTGELYARWFQFGAFCPLFRSHGRDWRLHLPWGWDMGTFGYQETPGYNPDPAELHNAAIEPICRRYLELRYRLLPYIYTAARETCATGLPLMRGLWLHYPGDATAVARDDEYLFGGDLLVAPVVEKGATQRSLYLPAGDWFDFWTGERRRGGGEITRPVDLATMPLYVRAGAVLPLGPVLQYTEQPSAEPLTLCVYPGADGVAGVYDDDGSSFDFHRGDFLRIDLRWQDAARRLSLRLASGARMLGAPRPLRLTRVGADESSSRIIVFDGREQTVTL